MKLFLSTTLIVLIMYTTALAQKEMSNTAAQDKIEVTVAQVSGDRFQLEIGASQGVRTGDQYEVIRRREGSLLGQYDIIGILRIDEVGENSAWCSLTEDREKMIIEPGDILSLRWIRESEMIIRERNSRFFFSIGTGLTRFQEEIVYEQPMTWINDIQKYYGEFFEVTPGSHYSFSLGLGLNKRIDIYGTFTVMRIKLEGVEYYAEHDNPDSIRMIVYSEDELANSYSLNTRILFQTSQKINPYAKLGVWLQENYNSHYAYEDEEENGYSGGILLGIGARWKISNFLSLLLEADAPIEFNNDVGSGYRISLLPELTVASW